MGKTLKLTTWLELQLGVINYAEIEQLSWKPDAIIKFNVSHINKLILTLNFDFFLIRSIQVTI